MSSISWIVNGGGAWNVAANWSGGAVPGAGDTVTLGSAAPATISFNTTDTVAGLTGGTDRLAIGGGTLAVTGATTLTGGLAETGGTLSLGSGVNSIAGATLGTGDVMLATGATLGLAGNTVLGDPNSGYGAHIYGAATLATTGIVTIQQNGGTGEATFGDGLTWSNTGTVVQAGIVNAAYNGGIAFTIDNQPGAVFDFTTDIACLMNMQIENGQGMAVTASSDFNNTGLLEKTGGGGNTTVYSTIVSTGTIAVQTGTIVIEDGGLVQGSVTGPGALQFTAGGTLSNALVTISRIEASGGDLTVAGVTLSGTLSDTAQIDQTGDLTLHATGATGTLLVGGRYDIDNNSSINAAGGALTIAAGGVLDKLGGAGTTGSNIAPAVTDNGALVVAAGTLRLVNALTGAGGVTIATGAQLVAENNVGAGIIVTLGAGSDLKLIKPTKFHGEISNFVPGDTLDVSLAVNAATITGAGTLELEHGGVTVASLALLGGNSGDVFSFGTDGHGGTLVEISGADMIKHINLAPAPISFVSLPEVSTPVAALAWHPPAPPHLAAPGPAIAPQPDEAPSAGGVISLSGTGLPALLGFATSHGGHLL